MRDGITKAGWAVDKEQFVYCPDHLEKMKGVDGGTNATDAN